MKLKHKCRCFSLLHLLFESCWDQYTPFFFYPNPCQNPDTHLKKTLKSVVTTWELQFYVGHWSMGNLTVATDHTSNDFSFHCSYQVTAAPQWGTEFHEPLLNYCWSCDCLGFLYSLSRLLQLKNSQEQQSCHVQKGDFQNTSWHPLTFVKFHVELNRSDP